MRVPDPTGTFQPIGDSDRCLPGATAVLACGLTLDEQARLRAALGAAGLAHLPLVGVAEGDADAPLRAIPWPPSVRPRKVRANVACRRSCRGPPESSRPGVP